MLILFVINVEQHFLLDVICRVNQQWSREDRELLELICENEREKGEENENEERRPMHR